MPSNADHITQLLTRKLSGEITAEEDKELREWMTLSDGNKAIADEFLDDEKLLSGIREIYRVEQNAWNRINSSVNFKTKHIWPWKYVAAASVIFILAAGAYFIVNRHHVVSPLAKTPTQDILPGHDGAILTLANGKNIVLDSAADGKITEVATKNGNRISYQTTSEVNVEYNTMTTPRGRQFSLVLPDGSQVWLNAESSITYPTAFVGNERKVSITGEVYFEVTHDASKPFSVAFSLPSGRAGEVEVLGTHFNINAYGDEESVKTTLLEGSVKLSAANTSITIKPGEQAQMNAGNAIGFTVNHDVNLDQVMAWKNGVFNFDNVDLQTIMRQLARWYDVEVVYQGIIPNEPFKGKISRNVPASKVLEILAYAGVHFKIDEKKIVVMP